MRATPAALGILALAAAWLAPLVMPVAYMFSAHMTRHTAVVAAAAPLLAAAVAHGRLDPARLAPRLFAPIPASVVELIAVWGWHVPLLHETARSSVNVLILEQGTFLCAGLFLWLSAIGGPWDQRGGRRAAGVVALLLTSMHMTLLGALFALSTRPLYGHPHAHAALDQQIGGAIMVLGGGVSYLAGGLWLMASTLRDTLAIRRA